MSRYSIRSVRTSKFTPEQDIIILDIVTKATNIKAAIENILIPMFPDLDYDCLRNRALLLRKRTGHLKPGTPRRKGPVRRSRSQVDDDLAEDYYMKRTERHNSTPPVTMPISRPLWFNDTNELKKRMVAGK